MRAPSRVPLTFQQEWLWDVIRENESWQVASVRAFRLSGSLKIPLLQQCLQEVVHRHSALRTKLVAVDRVVWQETWDPVEIWDPQEYLLQRVTVGGDSSAQIAANARRYVEDVCDRRMNLATDPLWNAQLLELSEREHWLVVAMHRLIGECVAIEQIYREVKSLYGERLDGCASAAMPPAQYDRYASWQQQTAANWAKRHEPYWKQHLTGAAPVEWPTDTDLGVVAAGAVGKAQCSFGRSLSAGLLDLARAVRTLPAVPMMAIYAAVLWRWCRQDDFVLPFNTAGRPTEYKSTIGYFSYALHLRVRITGDPTFRELVSHLGNEFFSSLSHQDFGRIARQQPELLAGTLFQWITWHPEETPEEQIGIREFGEGMTAVPLSMTALEVTVFDTPTELRAFGSYRADRFTAQAMERFMLDLRWAAELFIHNPDARISAVAQAGGNVYGTAERRAPGVAAGA
jgi:hypothetical protein